MDTLQVLGDIGDFVSAIAVVVTLALLVVQVRDSKRVIQENSALIRAAAFDTGLDQLSRWRGRLIESAEVASLWTRGGAGAPLTADDAARYDAMATDLLNMRISSYRRWNTAGDAQMAEIQVDVMATLCRRHPGFERWMAASHASAGGLPRGEFWQRLAARLEAPVSTA